LLLEGGAFNLKANYEKYEENEVLECLAAFPKTKRYRLKGEPLKQFNKQVHDRDGYTCIIKGCDRPVVLGEKFHHEPCGATKEDRIERACLLCFHHHYIRHHGKEGLKEVRTQCVEYLSERYPEDWEGLRERYVDYE